MPHLVLDWSDFTDAELDEFIEEQAASVETWSARERRAGKHLGAQVALDDALAERALRTAG